MNKKQLREQVIKQLKEIPASTKKIWNDLLTQHFIQSELFLEAKTIGLTIAKGMEWDTQAIITHAREKGKIICVPKCLPETKQMTFHRLDYDAQLEEGHYGLLEPIIAKTRLLSKAEIDLLLVPGVVFTSNGYRIGFGGGYYDRYLVGFNQKTAALLSEIQLAQQIPIDKFDIPVQYLFTENGEIEHK